MNRASDNNTQVTLLNIKTQICERKVIPNTSIEGYLMCIENEANGVGDGEDTHVSVFTRLLLEGRLIINFTGLLGNCQYELLNQLGDNNYHHMEATHGSNTWLPVRT